MRPTPNPYLHPAPNSEEHGNTTRTRILLAVVGGARTYGEIIAATGLARSTIHPRLHELRRQGLVTWADGRRGTIRPLVRQVPIVVPS